MDECTFASAKIWCAVKLLHKMRGSEWAKWTKRLCVYVHTQSERFKSALAFYSYNGVKRFQYKHDMHKYLANFTSQSVWLMVLNDVHSCWWIIIIIVGLYRLIYARVCVWPHWEKGERINRIDEVPTLSLHNQVIPKTFVRIRFWKMHQQYGHVHLQSLSVRCIWIGNLKLKFNKIQLNLHAFHSENQQKKICWIHYNICRLGFHWNFRKNDDGDGIASFINQEFRLKVDHWLKFYGK